MEAKEKVGRDIKHWREFKQMKQDEMARKLKITPAALSQIENGKIDITVGRIEQIARILEIDFLFLLESPQQVINFSSNQSSQEGVNKVQQHSINEELIAALKSELQTKNEQIVFLQSLLSPK